MPISKQEIESVRAPFFVSSDQKKRAKKPHGKVIGFSKIDPLGVGFQTAYFEDGGWVIIADLMKHFSIIYEAA